MTVPRRPNRQHEGHRVILVTGDSAGIGKATAPHLIRLEHVVCGAARRLDHVRDLVVAGGCALARDVTVEAAVRSTVE